MATPRKKNKIRDYDTTRRRMLEVVGEILRESGYAGLKTNHIARRLGKDKNLIRYYFNSLVNLEKTYIRENDYWFAFFEAFTLPESHGENDVREFFIKLMVENFHFFRDNIEMQKIILWQISENNPLMRSVSDQREAEGEKLLQMTDGYFNGTDVSFRAVIAILLGGIYYLVLHAQTNKSTVCSIDINQERGMKAVTKTIGQIICWAWEQGRDTSLRRSVVPENKAFNPRWKIAMAVLEMRGADTVLLKIMDLPFKRQGQAADYYYLDTFTKAIEDYISNPGSEVPEIPSLLLLLISLNFNHSRFLAYCFNQWENQTRFLPREKAVEKLESIKKTIDEKKPLTSTPFESRNKPVKEELNNWIGEELGLLTSGKSQTENVQQLEIKLKAVQSAYFAIKDHKQLKPVERLLEEMLSDIRQRTR